MPFLGKTPAQGFVNSVTKDDFTPNGTTTAFTLSKSPATVNEIEVYVGNVRQEPTDAYSVSGTTLTMTEAPVTGTNFYVMHIGGTTQSSTVLPGGSTVPGALSVSGVLDATTATFDRASTDGVIVDLQKDGTTVGSIGVNTSRPYFSGAALGLRIGGAGVLPTDSAGANTNGVSDLGASTAKWKDLYLGGGVYIGGTTSANKLTDYEQGTWAPVDLNGNAYNQAVTATYVKIGKLVFVYMDITSNSATVASGSNQVAGLPFTTATSSNAGTISQGYQSGTGNVTGHMYGTSIYLMNGESTSLVLNQRLIASGVYHTN